MGLAAHARRLLKSSRLTRGRALPNDDQFSCSSRPERLLRSCRITYLEEEQTSEPNSRFGTWNLVPCQIDPTRPFPSVAPSSARPGVANTTRIGANTPTSTFLFRRMIASVSALLAVCVLV